MFKRIILIVSAIIGLSFGMTLGPLLWSSVHIQNQFINHPFINAIIFALVFILLGMLLAPLLERAIIRLTEWINRLTFFNLVIGSIGILLGLLIGYLLSLPFSSLNIPFISSTLPIVTSSTLALVGYQTMTSRQGEIYQFFQSLRENRQLASLNRKETGKATSPSASPKSETYYAYKLLDTSVIIDGRIVDIVRTNFLEGTIVVPNFVLHELQLIADASDSLKRAKGRRGLDILNELQNNSQVAIEFYDQDYEDIKEVDSKLVRLAKDLGAGIVTNDYNLNKVCEFQNIRVYNINELANAVKPVLIPGESLRVYVIKAGTERKQGVAYLEDGTMIVVEDGQNYMNQEIEVIVTSSLQTAAGRMIFAKPVES